MENSIIKLLDKIETRPAMYINRNSISCLKSFLDGWYFREPEKVNDIIFLNGFQKWIELKYGQNSHSWDRIILFYSQGEATALENFFNLYNEYKKLKTT